MQSFTVSSDVVDGMLLEYRRLSSEALHHITHGCPAGVSAMAASATLGGIMVAIGITEEYLIGRLAELDRLATPITPEDLAGTDVDGLLSLLFGEQE